MWNLWRCNPAPEYVDFIDAIKQHVENILIHRHVLPSCRLTATLYFDSIFYVQRPVYTRFYVGSQIIV